MAWPVAPHAPHSRRTLLAQGLRGGILLAASPLFLDTAVIPSSRLTRWAIPMDQASTAPLVLATNRAPSDLDPHSAYDPGSQIALGGLFEGLIQIQTGTADTIDPVLAESWTANADKSVWTFFLRPDVTFQDGTPLDAEAARASFERLLTLGLAPSTVLGRFIDDPARITAPDSRTLVFDLGRPQPLFEAAIAAPGVGAVVNAAALRAHEVDGDWGHGWAQTNSDGIGTGPYRVASFEVEEGVILERYPEYWRGWAGEHFDGIAIRVVTEPETRLALIESGEADIVTTLPLATVQDLAANRQLLVDRRFTLAVSYVAMTVAGPLRSAEARQALCWAFPYDDVIDGIYEGFAKRAVGPVAELCRGFNPDTFVYSTDLDRARALLQRAGVAENTTITYALPAGNREANRDPRAFRDQPRSAWTSARHPGHRLRDVHRPLLRGAPRGGAPKPLFLLLVAGLQRRLESPVAPSFLRGLAGGQCWAVLQRACRSVAGGGEDRHRPDALFRGAGGDSANRHSRRSGRDLRRPGPVADRAAPRSGWVRPEFVRSRDHRFLCNRDHS